jgi:trk system potassium uptake protein TrkH
VNVVASRARVSLWWLWVMLAAPLGLDWFLPLRGLMSYGLCALVSVLIVPWAVATLRFTTAPAAELSDSRRRAHLRERYLWGIVLRVALVLLTCSFVVAKWSLLLAADARDASYAGSSRSYTVGLGSMFALGLAARDLRAARFLASVSLHPARLMALSFGGVGLFGTALLSLPICSKSMSHVSLVDNLFTAFSAVCVTGLATVSIADTYSLPGQVVVLALIQAGGLGIMVLSAAVAIMAGQRLGLKSSAMLTEVVDGASLATLRRSVLTICALTLIFEALGAVALYVQWTEHPAILQTSGHPMAGAGNLWWAAIFHAVSAFCNCGMSNFQGNLVPFSGYPLTLMTVGALVVVGGLGFPVLDELLRAAARKLARRRVTALSLHSRVVLRTTAVLLSVMLVGYVLLEWSASLGELPHVDRITVAAFQALVVRTGGFNALDYGAMLPPALLITCAAMFIGAGPGSTAGGIKVTTLVALLAGLRAELSGRAPRVLNRTLPDTVIRKAMGVAFLSMCIVMTAFFLLLLLESHAPLDLAFEAVSAFSTTGLSTGITPALSAPGKILICVLMFIGRIGPLTLALALAAKAEHRAVTLPNERVLIG